MKKENLKIFGTEYPSVQEYQNWVLDTNPETLQPWIPPLNSQEKSVISDPELVKKPQGRNSFGPISVEDEEWNSYQDKYLPIESAGLIISYTREAKNENLSNENILSYLSKLEEFQRNCINESSKYRSLLHNQVIKVLKNHGIILDEISNNLKKMITEKKDKIFKNLSEWRTKPAGNSIWKADGSGIHVKKEWFINEEEFCSLQAIIVQKKFEEIKNNPQDWKFFRASKIALPWSGGADHIEKKDSKEKFYTSDFNQHQWKEIENAVGSNFFLAFFQSSS